MIRRPGNAFIRRKTLPSEVVTVRSQWCRGSSRPAGLPKSRRDQIDRVAVSPAFVLARLATLTDAADFITWTSTSAVGRLLLMVMLLQMLVY